MLEWYFLCLETLHKNTYPFEKRRRMADDPALNKLKRQIQEAKKGTHSSSDKKGASESLGGKFFNVGAELVAGVFVGVGLGFFIDWAFGTSPWGLIFFFILV